MFFLEFGVIGVPLRLQLTIVSIQTSPLSIRMTYRCSPSFHHFQQAYLGFLEQHRGVETGVGVSDVQPTVVGHFLLQGADVRWRRRRDNPLQLAPSQKSESAPSRRPLPCIKSSSLGMSGNNWWNVLLCFMKLCKEKAGRTNRESEPSCSFFNRRSAPFWRRRVSFHCRR